MVLDTSAWVQLGAMGDVLRQFRGAKLVLDHHVSSDDLGADLFKDEHAEATGRLVVEAAQQLGVPITRELAQPLLAAITTDTGWFRFNSTTGDTLRHAGTLLDAGASPSELYRNLYEQDSLARLHLTGKVLSRVKTALDGRLIYTAALGEDFEATGAKRSDTEELVNRTLTVRGTEVAVMFVEQSPGNFKISFRSRSGFDVSRVAAGFGDGGHRAAAGAGQSGRYEDIRDRVLTAIRRQLAEETGE